jgi:uncharacterized repeat protein (TIGR03803 family)
VAGSLHLPKLPPLAAVLAVLIAAAWPLAARGQSPLTTLYSFSQTDTNGYNDDGVGPRFAGLVRDSEGNLYGTASAGGPNGNGTVFELGTNGSFSVLHAFSPLDNLGANGDGATPFGGLVMDHLSNLYGTTFSGGTVPGGVSGGTVFEMAGDGSFATLHSFNGSVVGSDGAQPEAGLVQGNDSFLYGTTASGGANEWGALYDLTTNGDSFSLLYSFSAPYNFDEANTDGLYPHAGLMQGQDGSFYGTTWWGGSNGNGTIFRFDTDQNLVTLIHSFNATDSFGSNADGQFPEAGLVQDSAGFLYGTATSGGTNGAGTVFEISTNGGTFATLHSFSDTGNDGAQPEAGLLMDTKGNLYGTTFYGGLYGDGTIFEISPNGSNCTTLYSFDSANGTDGANSWGPLTMDQNGNLYGTTYNGGANGNGTLFSLATIPSLQFSGSRNNLVLSWPSWATNFSLVGATSLGVAGEWAAITNQVSVSGQSFFLSNLVNSQNHFFKLKN